MKKVVPLGIACLLLTGCGSGGEDYMPLSKGATWSYEMLDAMNLYSKITVVGPAYVGSEKGWRILGDLGESRMGWKSGELKASMLSGTVYDPPITLIHTGRFMAPEKSDSDSKLRSIDIKPVVPKDKLTTWKGKVLQGGIWEDASATLWCQILPENHPDAGAPKIGGQAVRARLEITIGREKQWVENIFRARVGIVSQRIMLPGATSPVNFVNQTGGPNQ